MNTKLKMLSMRLCNLMKDVTNTCKLYFKTMPSMLHTLHNLSTIHIHWLTSLICYY